MGTRRLTLLRHGQAHAEDSRAEDFERTLTRRGIAEAKEMGSRIVQRRLIPDLILVSPAERAWSTASLVAAACELDGNKIRCARELYLATPETIWRLVMASDAATLHLMICGHNPGLSQIASRLGPKPRTLELPTAGLATAVWSAPGWAGLQPETAGSSELDDPLALVAL
jgi:phosphohistidine phosphatase